MVDSLRNQNHCISNVNDLELPLIVLLDSQIALIYSPLVEISVNIQLDMQLFSELNCSYLFNTFPDPTPLIASASPLRIARKFFGVTS